MAIVGRVLEAQGLRVGIIAQPDWRSARGLPRARRAAPVLRHHRREHGFDGQSLYRGPARTQRRCLHARRCRRQRPDRSVIVYAQRAREAYPRGADRDRRHRGVAAPHRAFRLLVGESAPLDPARCQGRPARLRQRRTRRSARLPSAWTTARASAISDIRGTAFVIRRPPVTGSRSIPRISMRPVPWIRRRIPMPPAPAAPGAPAAQAAPAQGGAGSRGRCRARGASAA